jgi:hypothetical protein
VQLWRDGWVLAACSFKLCVAQQSVTLSTVLKSMELNRIVVCVFVNLNEIAKNKKKSEKLEKVESRRKKADERSH